MNAFRQLQHIVLRSTAAALLTHPAVSQPRLSRTVQLGNRVVVRVWRHRGQLAVPAIARVRLQKLLKVSLQRPSLTARLRSHVAAHAQWQIKLTAPFKTARAARA